MNDRFDNGDFEMTPLEEDLYWERVDARIKKKEQEQLPPCENDLKNLFRDLDSSNEEHQEEAYHQLLDIADEITVARSGRPTSIEDLREMSQKELDQLRQAFNDIREREAHAEEDNAYEMQKRLMKSRRR